MSLLRQFLVVVVLGAIAFAGYTFQSGGWPILGSGNVASTQENRKGKGRKGRGGRTAPVLTAKVTKEIFRQTVEAVGTTRALQTVEIVPSSAGRIRSIAIKPGKSVKKGDILATLDDEIQRADLAEAKAKLEQAKRALARAAKLYRNRNIAEARVIEFRAAQAIAAAELARASRRLKDRSIRAPFAGRV